MLTREELIVLQRSLEQRQVLSVYLDGRVTDPASRNAWRAWLSTELESLRNGVSGDAAALRDFDDCAERVGAAVADTTGALRSQGWVAFAVPDRIVLAEHVPVPMPNAVRWTQGAWLSPYLRAQKELRPVLVVVVDARSARIFHYALGVLTPVDSLHAHARVPEPAHMGSAPRQHFHPGTRGVTGTDAAERARRDGTERMVRELNERISQLANNDAWVLVGGMPSAARAALAALPDELRSRAIFASGLSRVTPASSIRRAAATGAAKIRRDVDENIVNTAIGRAGENGRGTVGTLETRSALALDSVHMLLLSLSFMEQNADAAEEMTRLALAQHASIEIVSGEAAARLDAIGGTAALLRFPTPSLRPSPITGESPAP